MIKHMGDDCQMSTSRLIQSQQKKTLQDILFCFLQLFLPDVLAEGENKTEREIIIVHVGVCIVNGQGFK